jgi:hypothetical protein
LIFVGKPPPLPVEAEPPVRCNNWDSAALFDLIGASVIGVGALVLLSYAEYAEDDAPYRAAALGIGAGALGLFGLLAWSAGEGYSHAAACQELMDAQLACLSGVEESCRFLQGDPNPGAACSVPHDCRGGTECRPDDQGRGVCVEPAPKK